VAPPQFVAHRLPDTAAECDSLAAAGATGFELDIQLRGDTVVVSHYLPFLQIPGWLEHDGTRFRWGGGTVRHDPQLREAIERIPDSALVVLDPKEMRGRRRRQLAAAVSAALAEISVDRSRFVVTTGELADLRTYRAAGLATWRTVGAARELAAVLQGEPPADAGVAVRHTLLTPEVMARLRARAATIASWTVNDVGRARELAALGVDVITTDRTEVLSALRGQ
jgi:glycerophosphoryl diester phosphodiesterase